MNSSTSVATINRTFNKFNYLLNGKTGEVFPASEFHFYPLTVEDYVDFYRNYTKKSYPLMAFIYLTNMCSDNCIGCFAKTIEDGGKSLDLSTIKDLLDDLSENGTKAIKLAGREPTNSPYLSETLEYAAKVGLKSLVITSGAHIDRHEEAFSKYCTHMRVSLDAVSEDVHNCIHRPTSVALTFNQRLEVLSRILSERRERGLVSGATYLIRDCTIDNAYEYAELCKNLGFDYVRYSILDENKGAGSSSNDELRNRVLFLEDDSFKIVFHDEIPKVNFGCMKSELADPAIITRVTIHANGKVNACHEGWRGKWPVAGMATYGNINDTKFNELWNDPKRLKLLEYIENNYEKTNCTDKCGNACKYESFNVIQYWIIKQLIKDAEANIVPVHMYKNWR